MNAKHTPGPWKASCGQVSVIFPWLGSPGGIGYAHYVEIGIHKYCVAHTRKLCKGDGDSSHLTEEIHPDAALCAAAPDLLEALEKLLASFDSEIHNEYDGTSMLADRLAEADHARAAIAKARGEA